MRGTFILRLSLLIGLVGVLLALYLAYDLFASRQALLRNTMEAGKREAARAAREIDVHLRQYRVVVQSITEGLTSGRLTHDNLHTRLAEIIQKEPGVSGIGVAYAPAVFNRLNAPYVTRRGESVQHLQLEDRVDYYSGHQRM